MLLSYRDKGVHLLGHFREQVMAALQGAPSSTKKCPKCSYVARDMADLTKHYGLSHRVVFHLMQKELGGDWKVDESEENECRICCQVFPNNKMLTDHYCTQHFFHR